MTSKPLIEYATTDRKLKVCVCCKTEKSSTEFSPDKRASDGLQSRCRSCANEKRRAAYKADPDRARKYRRDYYAANTEIVLSVNKKSRDKHSEKIANSKRARYMVDRERHSWRMKMKKYRDGMRARKRAYDRLYREENRTSIDKRISSWRENNPERTAFIKKTYKARRRAIEKKGDPTAKLFAWEQAQQKVCYWCGVSCADSYHVDHYIPLSKGGAHTVKNLVIACPQCNLSKSAKDPYEFAASVGRLF